MLLYNFADFTDIPFLLILTKWENEAYSMENKIERRKERRLPIHWPIWFSDGSDATSIPAEMVNISSGGMAFVCENDKYFPKKDHAILLHFNVPRFMPDGSSKMVNFTRVGAVLNVKEQEDGSYCRISIQFTELIDFKPGEELRINNVLCNPVQVDIR